MRTRAKCRNCLTDVYKRQGLYDILNGYEIQPVLRCGTLRPVLSARRLKNKEDLSMISKEKKTAIIKEYALSLIHIYFKQFDTAYEEAEFIAADVCRKKRARTADYQDCAVLYRTNAQARLLEERFIVEGIPYDVVGRVNF